LVLLSRNQSTLPDHAELPLKVMGSQANLLVLLGRFTELRMLEAIDDLAASRC